MGSNFIHIVLFYKPQNHTKRNLLYIYLLVWPKTTEGKKKKIVAKETKKWQNATWGIFKNQEWLSRLIEKPPATNKVLWFRVNAALFTLPVKKHKVYMASTHYI